jgi:hypothetical protein
MQHASLVTMHMIDPHWQQGPAKQRDAKFCYFESDGIKGPAVPAQRMPAAANFLGAPPLEGRP